MSLSTESEPVMDAAPPDIAGLARAYGRTVFMAAYRVLGDVGQAEDVQQEVFLRLLEKPVGQIASWPAYLATLAVRTAIDRLRSRQRWRRLLPKWRAALPASFDSTEHDAVQAERARRLRAALCVLKPREAECFTLRYVQGMEISAIAQATGMTANHVGVCLHRAARALETRLGETPAATSTEVL
jgi:RNA polymerase sigma-70 factor (ECF subfamily)